MKTIIALFTVLILIGTNLISQNISPEKQDSIFKLEDKINKINITINKEKQKAESYYNQATDSKESAKKLTTAIAEGSNSEQKDAEIAGIMLQKAIKLSAKADSIFTKIKILKDSIRYYNKKLGNKTIEEPIENNEVNPKTITTKPKEKIIYTIQIGAELAKNDKLKVYKDVREYTCKDGYYRYIFGKFDSKEEAEKIQKELQAQGYQNAIIVPLKTITDLKK